MSTTLSRWACVSLLAACLQAPPEGPAADGDPCDGIAADGCELFTCPGSRSCYRFCVEERAFFAADCAGFGPGGKVVETETRDELECVHAHNVSSIWIGLMQDDSATDLDEGWRWVSTGETPALTLWDEIEPNDDPTDIEDGEEQCAIVPPTTGEWADVACSTPVASLVCEVGPG
jgi:hypothetical protein